MKQVSGSIMLYHWNELIATAHFHSVKERRDIMHQWNMAYGKNKFSYYQIRHTEISNVSKPELNLMQKLELETV